MNVTETGHIAGIFEMHDTHGFPLVESLRECKERGLKPDVPAFARDALDHGWEWDRVTRTVEEAVTEIDGEVYADGCVWLLNKMHDTGRLA